MHDPIQSEPIGSDMTAHALIATQVYLADLEDAIAQSDYPAMRHAAHRVAEHALSAGYADVTRYTEQIELLSTFRRDTDYMEIFEALRATLHRHYRSAREIPAG